MFLPGYLLAQSASKTSISFSCAQEVEARTNELDFLHHLGSQLEIHPALFDQIWADSEFSGRLKALLTAQHLLNSSHVDFYRGLYIRTFGTTKYASRAGLVERLYEWISHSSFRAQYGSPWHRSRTFLLTDSLSFYSEALPESLSDGLGQFVVELEELKFLSVKEVRAVIRESSEMVTRDPSARAREEMLLYLKKTSASDRRATELAPKAFVDNLTKIVFDLYTRRGSFADSPERLAEWIKNYGEKYLAEWPALLAFVDKTAREADRRIRPISFKEFTKRFRQKFRSLLRVEADQLIDGFRRTRDEVRTDAEVSPIPNATPKLLEEPRVLPGRPLKSQQRRKKEKARPIETGSENGSDDAVPTPFRVVLSSAARSEITSAPNEAIRRQIREALEFLSINPRHPGLATHIHSGESQRLGTTVLRSYVNHRTPAAWRIHWIYSPTEKGEPGILVLKVFPHD